MKLKPEAIPVQGGGYVGVVKENGKVLVHGIRRFRSRNSAGVEAYNLSRLEQKGFHKPLNVPVLRSV